MKQMISMKHSDSQRSGIIYIEWHLGNTCNYACSYCPPQLHSGSNPWVPLDTILRTVERLLEIGRERQLACHFDFTGGEVTLIPEFATVLKGIRDRGGKVSFISNGSRQLSWWQEVRDCLTGITLSFHIERASPEHFIRVARYLSQAMRIHVNVAMMPDRFDECLQVAREIQAQTTDVTIALKPLLIDFGTEPYPYTDEQTRIMADGNLHSAMTRMLVSSRGEMRILYDDGTSENMVPGKMIVKKLNRWSGWLCRIGVERLSISQSGRIYRGTCRQGGAIGDVNSIESFTLPADEIVCRKLECSCQADIMTTRFKNFLKIRPAPVSEITSSTTGRESVASLQS